MLSDRQQKILRAVVEEYIAEAVPVGSKLLFDRHNFGIAPAMIRQELAALEDAGYLEQPHTSAGRVPTDKAYRYYIAGEINKKKTELPSRDQERVKKVVSSSRTVDDLSREIARAASEISQELSVAGIEGGSHFVHGFSYLTSEPEFSNTAFLSGLMQFMDELDRSFETMLSEFFREEFGIFIGQENPVQEIRELAVITGRYSLPAGGRGFISVIGPRRMDYKKNMALVEYVSSIIGR